MSTITNSQFTGGETLNTTDINNKFQNITTATSSALNQDNLRDQSVDLAQMDSNSAHGRSGINLVSMTTDHVGTANDLTTGRDYAVNRTGTPLLDAAGAFTKITPNATLSPNDLLRVYFSGRIKTTCNISSGPNQVSNAAWAFWLQWDITSAGLTNFTEVPNQGDWSNQITGGRYAEPADVVLSATNGIASTAFVPHFVYTGGSKYTYAKNNVNGSYYYKNTGAAVTIYGLRLVVGGVYRGVWEQNSGGSARRNYVEYTTDAAFVDSSDEITVYNMQMSSIIMRTT
jgi:hypothetical protein